MTRSEVWERICIRQTYIGWIVGLFMLTIIAALNAPNFTMIERIAMGVVTLPAFIAVIIHEDVVHGLLWIGIPMMIGGVTGLPALLSLDPGFPKLTLCVVAGSFGGLIMLLVQLWIRRRFPSTRAS